MRVHLHDASWAGDAGGVLARWEWPRNAVAADLPSTALMAAAAPAPA